MTGIALQMVHYDPATGAIRHASSSFMYFEVPGLTLGEIDGKRAAEIYNPDLWLVDLTTIVERPGLPPLVQLVENPNPPTMQSLMAASKPN